MQRKAFGMIDLLLGLVITATVFSLTVPMLKSGGSKGSLLNPNSGKSVQEYVDTQVEQIEAMKKQQQEYFNQTLGQ